MSVPVGAERVKGGIVVVVVLFAKDIVAKMMRDCKIAKVLM